MREAMDGYYTFFLNCSEGKRSRNQIRNRLKNMLHVFVYKTVQTFSFSLTNTKGPKIENVIKKF